MSHSDCRLVEILGSRKINKANCGSLRTQPMCVGVLASTLTQEFQGRHPQAKRRSRYRTQSRFRTNTHPCPMCCEFLGWAAVVPDGAAFRVVTVGMLGDKDVRNYRRF
jgi:hypothetical protein